MTRSILVVDDEMDMRQLLKRSLEPDLGCEVSTAASGEEGLQMLSKQSFDLVLADIRMQAMDGMELLELIKRANPDQTVVMITGYGGVEMAVEAMKSGAYDFITKPFDHDALLMRLDKALERSRLIKENMRLQEVCGDDNDLFHGMVGKSDEMQRVFKTVEMVAKTDLTVLITGESGTGKDLTARAIHALSPRKNGAFVAVNCPTLPEHILESELFGYKKGAFTHAFNNKDGLFQEANNGTIFLDEIGDITPTIQTKLLRVLQEKEIKPLGHTKSVQINTRIIASTNQNLKEKMKTGEFREDFFYRLNVLPIAMPALRDRKKDIPLIANYLVKKHVAKLQQPKKKLSSELLSLFLSHEWTGNIREMENIITQGVLFSKGEEILPKDVGMETDRSGGCLVEKACQDLPYKKAKEETLHQFNSNYIGHRLTETRGNVTLAAKNCGLERQALQQIMRRYKIKADQFRKK